MVIPLGAANLEGYGFPQNAIDFPCNSLSIPLEVDGMADEAATAKDLLAAHAAAMGRRGGKARLVKMTAEERTRIAKIAAQARWAKKAEAPDPSDPKGPKRDERQGPGIMSTRKPCRRTGISPLQPTLFEIQEPAHVRVA